MYLWCPIIQDCRTALSTSLLLPHLPLHPEETTFLLSPNLHPRQVIATVSFNFAVWQVRQYILNAEPPLPYNPLPRIKRLLGRLLQKHGPKRRYPS